MKSKVLKKIISIVVACWFFLLLNVLIGYSLEDTKAAQDEAKELTAIKIIADAIKKLEKQPIDKDGLEKQIINSPLNHKNKEESRGILRNWYGERLRNSLRDKVSRLYKIGFVTKEWLEKKQVDVLYGKRISSIIKEVVDSNEFTEAFKQARLSAVEKQWQNVRLGIYPSPTDVENIDQGGVTLRNRIEQTLKENMSGRVELLEENEKRLEGEINRVITHALSQLQGQRNLVKNSMAEGSFSEGTITRKLMKELKQYIIEQKQEAKPSEKIYNVFPSVKTQVYERAKELMNEKFQMYISDEFHLSINEGKIKKWIEENPKGHYDFNQSFEELQRRLIPHIKTKIVGKYIEKTGEVSNKDFQEKLNNLLTKDSETVHILNGKINKGIRRSNKRNQRTIS